MALTDIQFTEGETDGMIVELDAVVYNGTLTDIQMGNVSNQDTPQTELQKPTVVVDGRRRVR